MTNEAKGRRIPRLCYHKEGGKHDCAYVDMRNRAVGPAWAEALRETGDGPAAVRVFLAKVNVRCGTPNYETADRARREALRS